VRTAFFAAAAGAIFLLAAGPAAANGRFPLANQIVFSPSDPNVIVLRATYGIFLSRDNGKTWPLVCEDVLGLPTTTNYEDPELGFTANGSLLAGLLRPASGLDISSDLGCNWGCSSGALANQAVADLVVRPDKPNVVLAVTQTFQDGGTLSQVFESTDNGATWAPLGKPFDPLLLLTTIDVSRSDPNRIYVSGTSGFGAAKTASLFVSTDHGATWNQHMLPSPAMFDPNSEDSIFIGAVDPTDPDRVYLRSSGPTEGGQSRLTFTTATGGALAFHLAKMFETPPSSNIVGELLGFALSPDGSKVYVGTLESGLWVASKADMTFHQASTIQVACLATRTAPSGQGTELWACSKEVSGFIAGVSTDDGGCFYPKLHICGMRAAISCNANPGGPVGCGADANASQCSGAPLASIDPAIGCVSADAGENSPLPFVGDACAAGGGGTGATPPASSGGCSFAILSGGGVAAGFVTLWSLVGLALRRRRRR
jgi:hypothetical protein